MKLLSKIKAKVPDWLWAGATSGLAGGVASFGLIALSVLGHVAEWAGSQGQDPFPDLSVLGYGLVSATVGVGTAVVNAVYRWAQSKTTLIPGNGPTYGKSN